MDGPHDLHDVRFLRFIALVALLSLVGVFLMWFFGVDSSTAP